MGQWSSSVDCWLALFVLSRLVALLAALEAHWRICVRFCTGVALCGRGVVLCVEGRASWLSVCGVAFVGCGSGGIRLGVAALACKVICMRRHDRLVGLGGGGEWSSGVGVCGAVFFGC